MKLTQSATKLIWKTSITCVAQQDLLGSLMEVKKVSCKKVARIASVAAQQNASEVFGNLYQTLEAGTARAFSVNRKKLRGHISELRNLWTT